MITCPRCSARDIPDTAPGCPRCGYTFGDERSPAIDVVSPDLERNLRRDLGTQFQISELLGRGGMSLVYLAHEVALSRAVALKVLPLQFIHSPDTVRRFEREAKIAASLDHPHIVPIFGVGATSTFLWYSMRLIKGRSLAQVIAEHGPMSVEACLAIIEQVGSALDYAHRHGVVHRDVKPANVMVEDSGWALVCDFGVARAFGSVALTQTGSSLGTPRYMSPEQFESRTADGRSDQYSLAVLAFEALTGDAPFIGDSLGELVRKHLLEAPPRASDLRPDIPAAVSDALQKGMSKQPDNRFADVAEFVSALGGKAVAQPPATFGSLPGTARAPSRRPEWDEDSDEDLPAPVPSRRPLFLWLGVALLAVAGGAWAIFGGGHETAAAPPPVTFRRPDTTLRVDSTPARRDTAKAAAPRPQPTQRGSRTSVRPPQRQNTATRTAAPPTPAPAPAESVAVAITSVPIADVLIDGRAVSQTPITGLKLPIGEHRVQLKRDGYRTWEQLITLVPGQPPKRLTGITLQPVRP